MISAPACGQDAFPERVSSMGTTATLAEYVSGMSFEQLPGAVVAAAKVALLDGVANLVAGSTQPTARLVADYVRELGGTPTSSVMGRGFRTNAPSAAFAN